MKLIKRQKGQSLVEFALIFPIVFFLITGFIDLGRAVFYYSSLSNAVREATRYAIVHNDALEDAIKNPSIPCCSDCCSEETPCLGNGLQTKVLEFAFGLTNLPDDLTPCTITVEVRDLLDNKITDVNTNYVKIFIHVVYPFKPITPGITAIVGGPIPLDVKSTMFVSPTAR